ncbi:MAG: hypothetical protein A2754_02500 [Candidatus Magasanikbacteria bacterium RIFCSPHIGHO2_01_FULL_47_8]|uniref:Uncharacterized protein n=1 Tax=Candidatus Magasanikbacteria bacterium RIFCSPHIGHO2_01_FULL_47_8 TaxID=1798673 RepID=A0A1F6MBQ0_9BACT|nr:MAG: hypothetical protein A2754_02500 [Candidatus Magasanikbacteria bacterium RIFCSPHIGHO2_01_FULL_47_8]
MAISPQECIVVAQEDKGLLESLEQKIDNKLRTEFDSSSGRYVFSLSGSVRQVVVNALIAKYKAAGWRVVEYGSDQRDVAWFSFRI